jgi:hypothetical protein
MGGSFETGLMMKGSEVKSGASPFGVSAMKGTDPSSKTSIGFGGMKVKGNAQEEKSGGAFESASGGPGAGSAKMPLNTVSTSPFGNPKAQMKGAPQFGGGSSGPPGLGGGFGVSPMKGTEPPGASNASFGFGGMKVKGSAQEEKFGQGFPGGAPGRPSGGFGGSNFKQDVGDGSGMTGGPMKGFSAGPGMMKGTAATPGSKSTTFGFGGMKMPATPQQPPNSGPGFGANSMPPDNQSFGSFEPTQNRPGGFGPGASFASGNQPPIRASEVSTILSSLANDESRGMQNQSNFQGPPRRAAMPSPIGELNIEASARYTGSKPGSDTLLGSLASGSGDQFNPNRRTRATATSFTNGPANEGVRSGGDTVGGFRPLSVTITDPKTGKKRTISVTSVADTGS